jgi:hypothetical protein
MDLQFTAETIPSLVAQTTVFMLSGLAEDSHEKATSGGGFCFDAVALSSPDYSTSTQVVGAEFNFNYVTQ